ncbi:EAL domain-containing protein [Enterobacter cloacae]|nr:EAL domain-containing protein [Enterobacter cloacae]
MVTATGYCMKIGTSEFVYNLTFRLEPIVSRENYIYGYELLTEIYSEYEGGIINPGVFFNTLSLEMCAKVLNVQIGKVNILKKNINKPISLNLNERLLILLVEDHELLSSIHMLRNILRVEISEEIDLKKNLKFLMKLRRFAPLWLDDFGGGDITIQKKYLKLFEVVKIDRVFLKNILEFKYGVKLIDEIICNLHMENIDVICEGVENITELKTYYKHDFEAYQGWFWKSRVI